MKLPFKRELWLFGNKIIGDIVLSFTLISIYIYIFFWALCLSLVFGGNLDPCEFVLAIVRIYENPFTCLGNFQRTFSAKKSVNSFQIKSLWKYFNLSGSRPTIYFVVVTLWKYDNRVCSFEFNTYCYYFAVCLSFIFWR